MARYDDEGIWEWEPTGILDEDGEDMGDYVLVGSIPLDHWGAMVYRLEQVEVPVNMLQGVW